MRLVSAEVVVARLQRTKGYLSSSASELGTSVLVALSGNLIAGKFIRIPPMTMRRLLLALLFLGLVGTGAELLLLQHTESLWELIPLVLIGLTLVILTWHVMGQRPASIRALQGTMGLFLIAGFAGLVLHYQSNMEFKLETNPSLAGWALFWAVLTGKSPPALAPGAMIQLGLLGLAYAYHHPALVITDLLKPKNKGEENEA